MQKILPAALAAAAIMAAAAATPAEARCLRTGHHHWSCGYHRMHYAHRGAIRFAAAYGYPSYGLGYGYYGSSTAGYGSSYSSAAMMGPSPRSGGGP